MKTLFLSLFIACLICGCASWQTAGGKTLVTVAQTVDTAMKGWEAYSVAYGISDNDPKEQAVKVMYVQYQRAFSTALTAYNAAVNSKDQSVWSQASAALSSSQGNLVALIAQLEGTK